jgi:hypothetical protein
MEFWGYILFLREWETLCTLLYLCRGPFVRRWWLSFKIYIRYCSIWILETRKDVGKLLFIIFFQVNFIWSMLRIFTRTDWGTIASYREEKDYHTARLATLAYQYRDTYITVVLISSQLFKDVKLLSCWGEVYIWVFMITRVDITAHEL